MSSICSVESSGLYPRGEALEGQDLTEVSEVITVEAEKWCFEEIDFRTK